MAFNGAPRPMKTLALTLAALVTVTAFAETPEQIAADYRAKAKTALEKVNSTLEKATVPIIADLVKAGDTTGADEVKDQLKAKQDGEPVAKPHAKAANLFTLYDAARLRALDPIQQATIRKLDAVLAAADGKKLEVVDAVKTVRAEVEAGRVSNAGPMDVPVEWTYHRTPTSPAEAAVFLNPDGSFVMGEGAEKRTGKWKPGKEPNTLTIRYAVNDSTWKVSIQDGLATVDRPDIKETRYFRVKK